MASIMPLELQGLRMEKLTLALIGGGLLVYGFISKNKKRPSEGNQFVDIQDPTAQTEGNIALALGVAMLLGVFFA